MNNLAVLYLDQGQYAKAEPLFVKALEVRRRVLGEEHPDTLTSMNNLALLYQAPASSPRPSRFVKALEIDRDAGRGAPRHARLHEQPGGAVPGTGSSPGRAALRKPGVRRRVLGTEHPDTLTSMNNLALLYQARASSPRPSRSCVKALEVRRRVLGEEHPDTLTSMNNLAALYRTRASSPRPSRSSSRHWRSAAASWGRSTPTRSAP